jgi:Kef-type K+ transport system membrane component KefB
MIPRGEVGLIFAGIGKSLKVIDDATFSALIVMVMATTLIAPILLKQTLLRWERKLRLTSSQ